MRNHPLYLGTNIYFVSGLGGDCLMMRWQIYKPGDPVVYRAIKNTSRPGPRAECINPSPRGETYQYQVNKLWVVAEVLDNGDLLLRTRRGKSHRLAAANENLRHATWWERIKYAGRFPGHVACEATAR